MSYRSTKRGKPVRSTTRRGYGFHWYGRDDQGVSVYAGDYRALKWGGRLLGSIGPILLCSSLVCLIVGGPLAASGVLALAGTIHSFIGYMLRRQHLGIEALATVEQASKDLQLGPEQIEEVISEQAIKPRVIINGQAYFDPADLGEAATLLRAAPPPPDEELLRAAYAGPTDSDTLLQSANEPIPNTAYCNPPSDEPITLKQGTDDA